METYQARSLRSLEGFCIYKHVVRFLDNNDNRISTNSLLQHGKLRSPHRSLIVHPIDILSDVSCNARTAAISPGGSRLKTWFDLKFLLLSFFATLASGFFLGSFFGVAFFDLLTFLGRSGRGVEGLVSRSFAVIHTFPSSFSTVLPVLSELTRDQ